MATNIFRLVEGANLMAETETNGNKFSMSYPLLTIILTVVLYLTGHLAVSVWWASQMQSNMAQAMIALQEEKTTRQKDRDYYQTQIELQKVYIDTLREKQVRMEVLLDRKR